MSTYYISPSTLSLITEETFMNDEEVCCFMVEKIINENLTEVYFDYSSCNKGTKVEYQYSETETRLRATCKWKFTTTYPSYPKFIIHSHPSTSKPYPSFEDIRSLFLHPQVRAQFISTRDGLWILNLPRNIRVYVKSLYFNGENFNYERFNKHHLM